MPKNKGKGGKNRRRGKNESDDIKRELITAEPGQCYARVVKMLGNGNLEGLCSDNQKRLCHIRGKMNKKIWINSGDIILIGVRDFQNEKADVILKYTPDEARMLKVNKEIPEYLAVGDSIGFEQEQIGEEIFFEDKISGQEYDEETNLEKDGNLNHKNQKEEYISSDYSDEEDEDTEDL